MHDGTVNKSFYRGVSCGGAGTFIHCLPMTHHDHLEAWFGLLIIFATFAIAYAVLG